MNLPDKGQIVIIQVEKSCFGGRVERYLTIKDRNSTEIGATHVQVFDMRNEHQSIHEISQIKK